MQDNQQGERHSRVRHVPIRVESRQNQHVYSDSRQNENQQRYDDRDRCRCNSAQDHQFHNNHRNSPYSSQTLPNTSSININYRPSAPQRQSPVESSFSADDSYGRNPDSRPHQHHHNHQQQQQGQDQLNVETAANKENKDFKTASRGPSPSDGSTKNSDKLVHSDEAIPLPPPPQQPAKEDQDQAKRSNKQQARHPTQQQQPKQQSEESAENKKTKMDSGPLGIIASTRAEVSGLLQDIVKFNGKSLKAREYIVLDELLTRCILKLDDIQCNELPGLRQQRKAVIELIDKCTDILQRKVQLNQDIDQLLSDC